METVQMIQKTFRGESVGKDQIKLLYWHLSGNLDASRTFKNAKKHVGSNYRNIWKLEDLEIPLQIYPNIFNT